MSACSGDRIVGDVVVLTSTFRNTSQVLTDPASYTVKMRAPDGTVTTYTDPDATIDNPSTGIWVFTSPIFDAAGDWYFYIAGVGGGASAAEQIKIKVGAPKMALV